MGKDNEEQIMQIGTVLSSGNMIISGPFDTAEEADEAKTEIVAARKDGHTRSNTRVQLIGKRHTSLPSWKERERFYRLAIRSFLGTLPLRRRKLRENSILWITRRIISTIPISKDIRGVYMWHIRDLLQSVRPMKQRQWWGEFPTIVFVYLKKRLKYGIIKG